jgi:hypothetical protein
VKSINLFPFSVIILFRYVLTIPLTGPITNQVLENKMCNPKCCLLYYMQIINAVSTARLWSFKLYENISITC